MATKTKAPPVVDDTLPAVQELFAFRQIGKQADDQRSRLAVGEHTIDMTVHLKGTMFVASDGPSLEVVESPKSSHLLGLVLQEIGPKKLGEILPAIVEQLVDYRKTGLLAELPDAAKNLAMDLERACERRCTKSRRGNVTGAITATVKRRAA